jgi:hypothetical protein
LPPREAELNAIRFEVSYRLGEYRQFALDHLGRMAKKPPGLLMQALVSILVVPSFLFKSAKVGRCSFTIDDEGLVRRSSMGELRIPSAEITAVHRYTRGFLVEKRQGAVPIPYRCLDAEQRRALETWASRRA